ncbi:MAG TPA: T9SS type A sorting domain-containing protein [Bacteroidia bacterium]|nr:T9SS type A sorting domain-containing protein [Bacteroidia bacterium]HRH06933.1 T9SS type A sorting domain-containing protein [Bacteroidia bacterium]
MKKSVLLFVLLVSLKSFSQTTDTISVSYNFNTLSTGNLNGQGGWLTNKLNTVLDAIVQNTTSVDGTNSIGFTGSGPSVGVDACRSLDTIFSGIRFSDMQSTYVISFDIIRNYWGVNVGVGTDFNNDGKIIHSAANEKAIDFKVASVVPAQERLTLPNGATTTYTSIASNVWTNVEITIYNMNVAGGKIDVKTKPSTASTWITLVSGASLGLDSTSTTKTNPKLWDMVYIHFEGAGGYFDNLSIKRKYTSIPSAVYENEQQQDLSIRSNPQDQTLQIDLQSYSTNTMISLYDVAGKKISEMNLQNGSNRIDVRELKGGYYFYSVQNSSGLIRNGKLCIVTNK